MRILVVNDDGYEAFGLTALADALARAGHAVTVVAPALHKSGASQSMTFFKAMTLKKIVNKNYVLYALNGTPADCTKLALDELMNEKPDILVSGINSATNLGGEIHYSGTLGAAAEGAINGIPSIALSLDGGKEGFYEFFADYFAQNLDLYLAMMSVEVPINVNFNKLGDGSVKNVITTVGTCLYSDYYSVTDYDDGDPMYMLQGEPLHHLENEENDVTWYSRGYTTITPINIDRTHHASLERLKNAVKRFGGRI